MVSLETALKHLHLVAGEGSPDPVSVEVADKLAQAEAIVLAYIARPTDDDWTAEIASWQASPAVELPGGVKAAILAQLGELYVVRGDVARATDVTVVRVDGQLSPLVRAYLAPYRDPVVA